jgi:hypothetical protein
MRTGSEARQFFKIGRVFAMLYTEPASGASRHNNNDAYTTVRFGAEAFTQIRRFVVVSVRRNFVHAWYVLVVHLMYTSDHCSSINTYNRQGTTKHGCDPGEHAVVYNTGVDPESCYLPNEKGRGLYKDPIQVYPADSGSHLQFTSRIRFGMVYSIEWNVKVKDVGRVVAEDLSTLTAHYNEENGKWESNY